MTMHPTLPLFTPQAELKPRPRIARSHASDPDTSHQAATKHNRTGQAKTNLARVVRLVHALPDRTSGELAEQVPAMGLQELRRRLVDAKRFGHVAVSGSRVCRIHGTRQSTWRAVGELPAGTLVDVEG